MSDSDKKVECDTHGKADATCIDFFLSKSRRQQLAVLTHSFPGRSRRTDRPGASRNPTLAELAFFNVD